MKKYLLMLMALLVTSPSFAEMQESKSTLFQCTSENNEKLQLDLVYRWEKDNSAETAKAIYEYKFNDKLVFDTPTMESSYLQSFANGQALVIPYQNHWYVFEETTSTQDITYVDLTLRSKKTGKATQKYDCGTVKESLIASLAYDTLKPLPKDLWVLFHNHNPEEPIEQSNSNKGIEPKVIFQCKTDKNEQLALDVYIDNKKKLFRFNRNGDTIFTSPIDYAYLSEAMNGNDLIIPANGNWFLFSEHSNTDDIIYVELEERRGEDGYLVKHYDCAENVSSDIAKLPSIFKKLTNKQYEWLHPEIYKDGGRGARTP